MTRSVGLRFALVLPVVALASSCTMENPQPFANGGITPAPPMAPSPTPTAPTSTPTPTGQVVINVQDPTGKPLSGVSFSYPCPGPGPVPCDFAQQTGAGPGVLAFGKVPVGTRDFNLGHPLGWANARVSVLEGLKSEATVWILPESEATVSLLSVEIPATSIASDRSELDLRVNLAISASWLDEGITPPNSWLGGVEVLDCFGLAGTAYSSCGQIPTSDVAFQSVQLPYSFGWLSPMQGRTLPLPVTGVSRPPLSAMLLLDQGRRVSRLDPYSLRHVAARNFATRMRPGDQLTIAGFAGPYGDPASPAVLPQTPLWVSPLSSPHEAIDDLVPRTGGGSPLLDALDAATEYLAAMSPAGQRRALVVLTAGTDDAIAAAADRRLRWQALRQRQSALGIETILIVRKHPPASDVGELVEWGPGQVIVLRVPEDPTEWNFLDDLYSAVGLAADLLMGGVRTYDLVFRIKAVPGTGFPAGSLLRGQAVIHDECSPWWAWCDLHVPFFARVP